MAKKLTNGLWKFNFLKRSENWFQCIKNWKAEIVKTCKLFILVNKLEFEETTHYYTADVTFHNLFYFLSKFMFVGDFYEVVEKICAYFMFKSYDNLYLRVTMEFQYIVNTRTVCRYLF